MGQEVSLCIRVTQIDWGSCGGNIGTIPKRALWDLLPVDASVSHCVGLDHSWVKLSPPDLTPRLILPDLTSGFTNHSDDLVVFCFVGVFLFLFFRWGGVKCY